MFKKIQALVSGGKKAFEYVKPKPKVNKTKLDTAKSNLNIAIQKGKAANAKLKQTQFEIANPEFKGKEFTFAKSNKKTESNKEAYKRIQKQNTKALKSMVDEAFNNKKEKKTKVFVAPKNFNKGGRVGLKLGSKKSNVQKIKETFNPKKSAAKKKKFPDLTGDGKVTFADILKGRGVKRG